MNLLKLFVNSYSLSVVVYCSLIIIHCNIVFAHTDSTTADTSLVSTSQTTPVFHAKKSPWLAVGLSAVAPGVGQIYNADYWKPPIIWGVGGYWVSVWIELDNKYKDYGEQYTKSISLSSPDGNGQYLRLRNFYRDERDKFAWYLGALYFLNLLDAYVGANLYDFDVSPDLGTDGKISPRVTATIRLKF